MVLTTVLSPGNLSPNRSFLVRGTCEILGRIWKPMILENSGFIREDPWAYLETLLHLFVFLWKEVLEGE